MGTSDFIRDKHDPNALAVARPCFRTVLSWEFIADPQKFMTYAAHSGQWYYSKKYKEMCLFVPQPLDTIPGSAVPANMTTPTSGFGGLLIAQPLTTPHAYAEDIETFNLEVSRGEYQAIEKCKTWFCGNISLPQKSKCAKHSIGNRSIKSWLARVLRKR